MTHAVYERLATLAGRESGTIQAPDPVNVPMIRHWVEAMGDDNPVYLDEAAARATGRPGVIAPPTMLQAWTMRGYAATQAGPPGERSALTELLDVLSEAGFRSVVATDCEQEYLRELVPGDRISVTEIIESVSPEKRTALGIGHFVTTVRTYNDQHGETVAVQRWRLLRFRPDTGPAAEVSSAAEPQPRESSADQHPLRPRPAPNRDNTFWFQAARQHRLVVQRCASCRQLRHPPGPCCPRCRSFDWDTVEARGTGTVHSFVINHHPQIAPFEYPLVVVLVELSEGVRLVANVVGVQPEDVQVGMPVVLDWLDADPELSLPAFRPAADRSS